MLPPGLYQANVGAFFIGGGVGMETGKISAPAECEPGTFLYGTPSIGGTVNFVMSGAPGCCGCLGLSINPGPTTIPNIPGCPAVVVPLGAPITVLIPTTPLGTATTVTVPVSIPNDPGLVGAVVYFAVVQVVPGTGKLFGSTGSSVTILP